MNESDYVKVTNKTILRHVCEMMKDVMDGEEYGIDKDKLAKANSACYELLEDAFMAIKVKE